MASQQPAVAASTPSAHVVGNAFVQQFFLILHKSPGDVHRFYQEGSKLGRPGDNGEMSTSSTLQSIDEKILSMGFGGCRAQIKTVDAQESLNGGVLVLVTGYLFGKDDVRRDFAQTFFLATQDKGYYVLNDIFRYVEEADQQQEDHAFGNETDSPISPDHDTDHTEEHLAPEQTVEVVEEDEINHAEVYDPSEHEEESALDEELPVEEVIDETPSVLQPAVADPGPSTAPEQKKSYASIVKVMSENPAPLAVPTFAPIRAAPPISERQAPAIHVPPPPPASEVPAPGSYVAESNNLQESETDGHSIYIKNLPLNATALQLEEEFKKFGPIKPNGIQVRSNKLQGFCFGFVEYEVATAVQSAIEASPILIGGRQAYVEEKRTTGSRVNNRGRFAPGRGGGFRSDGIRGRGGYGGGRGYGRGDYNNSYGSRGGGRGGGPSGRGDMGYQRVDHSGTAAERGSRAGSLPRVQASA